MKMQFWGNKDFWAGMTFFGTGAGTLFIARNYPFGTTLRMGPGYFPIVLSGILIAFGLYIMLRGLRNNEKIAGNWVNPGTDRATPFHNSCFGILMNLAGFIPALTTLVFVSAAAERVFRLPRGLTACRPAHPCFRCRFSSGVLVCPTH